MKKRLLVGIISSILLLCTTVESKAQISFHLNIGTQPVWGPEGYDQADYYYLPDIESYYSVSTHQFIYMNGGRWIYANNLPPRYANYDLYSGYKVVVNRPRPYLNFNQDRAQYARYRGYRGHQVVIRDSKDERYHGRGGNPHGMSPGQANHDNRGDHRDQGRDNRGDRRDQGHDNHDNRGDKGHGDQKDQGHGNDNKDHGDKGDHGHGHGGN
jgi:hypothetical protein